MPNRFVLRSRRVFRPDQTTAADVVICQGRIESLAEHGSMRAVDGPLDVIDVGDAAVLPGLVDPHVHLNEPGRADWEGFDSGTRAAKAGGVTTLIDMPLNSSPVTIDESSLRQKRESAAGKLHVDVGFHAGLVPASAASIDALIGAGCVAAKAFLCPSGIDEFPHADIDTLRTGMTALAAIDAVLLAHAEITHDLPPMADPRRYADYLQSRPRTFERHAIQTLIDLCRQTRCRTHIVHLSDADSLDLLRAARGEGLPVTVETCPHYLCLNCETIPDGATQFKCAPPIRDRDNQDRLWQGLIDGEIDMIVSDHSPCPVPMKHMDDGRFDLAWGGISSLQLGLPLVWTHAIDRGLDLRQVVRWMSTAPARLFGMPQGIAVGSPAHLVVFDDKATWTIDQARLRHRNPITPYHGRTVRGVVLRTFVHGNDDDQPRGRCLS